MLCLTTLFSVLCVNSGIILSPGSTKLIQRSRNIASIFVLPLAPIASRVFFKKKVMITSIVFDAIGVKALMKVRWTLIADEKVATDTNKCKLQRTAAGHILGRQYGLKESSSKKQGNLSQSIATSRFVFWPTRLGFPHPEGPKRIRYIQAIATPAHYKRCRQKADYIVSRVTRRPNESHTLKGKCTVRETSISSIPVYCDTPAGDNSFYTGPLAILLYIYFNVLWDWSINIWLKRIN
ncbi:hypothetical protein CHS0354_029127 [Potamilus streckersoni]|uniref:Uncharacterized protein n=1 Tax=Potamilus streckersoni TaxID=2493646 RepID=A0AAE0SXD4_9BIVA|nr:hypothetical protein CHS0354_029127 [Potamilus streckersoni]